MMIFLQVFFVLSILVLFILFVLKPNKRIKENTPLPDNYRQLLNDYVKFYEQLDDAGKNVFEVRLKRFLSNVRITGANAIVEDIDIILIGAGAIIPVYLKVGLPKTVVSYCNMAGIPISRGFGPSRKAMAVKPGILYKASLSPNYAWVALCGFIYNIWCVCYCINCYISSRYGNIRNKHLTQVGKLVKFYGSYTRPAIGQTPC